MMWWKERCQRNEVYRWGMHKGGQVPCGAQVARPGLGWQGMSASMITGGRYQVAKVVVG